MRQITNTVSGNRFCALPHGKSSDFLIFDLYLNNLAKLMPGIITVTNQMVKNTEVLDKAENDASCSNKVLSLKGATKI
jgi:hypothetical protein